MKYAAPVVGGLLALFLIGSSAPQADSAEPKAKNTQSDQERIQGLWIYVTLTQKQEDRILFSGGRMYFYVGKKTTTGRFALDATKKPKQIDLTNPVEKDRTITLQGIYQFLKGDLLSICFGEVNGPRPTDFTGGKKQRMILFVRGKEEIWTGTFTATVKGEEWTLHLDTKGRVTIKRKGNLVVDGTFIATKTEFLVFTDEKGRLADKENTRTAKYRWKMGGKKLSFTQIDDDCRDRVTALTASAWMPKELRLIDKSD